MIFSIVKHHKISSWFLRSKSQYKLNGDISLRISVLADKRLGYLLTYVFLRSFLSLSTSIDEVEHLSLLNDNS